MPSLSLSFISINLKINPHLCKRGEKREGKMMKNRGGERRFHLFQKIDQNLPKRIQLLVIAKLKELIEKYS